MSKAYFEDKLFSVCLDPEKKQIMSKALDTHLDLLIRVRGSEKEIQRYTWLKEEIDKMSICIK